MLRKKDKILIDWLKQSQRSKTPAIRGKEFRIRKKAIRALTDLAYLAKNLPEKQARQIFTREKLVPFFEALITSSEEEEAELKKKDYRDFPINPRKFEIGTLMIMHGARVENLSKRRLNLEPLFPIEKVERVLREYRFMKSYMGKEKAQ